ncbi:helix-turn-helix domain-containing protein [Rhodoferax ferrireducens]|uniref:helix-turn-helix domain-containing protein n=1 Tax=Rhodoferax ferrireducens TaxID=192843 RepID=UPI0013007880|nr:helix-turn-helix domain-containing protein [Rhodoferax ferrireducens]
MSLKEADRYAVILQVIERTMAQSDAALWLNISVRQVKRLVRAIRQDGAQGAVSKRWGVPSNRRISLSVRDRFVGLVREHYADFGPTLACVGRDNHSDRSSTATRAAPRHCAAG